MDKFLRVPSIKNLDELLELIGDQKKFTERLTQLQQVRNQIRAEAEKVATQDEADALLRQATAKMDEMRVGEAKLAAKVSESMAKIIDMETETEVLVRNAKVARESLAGERAVFQKERDDLRLSMHSQAKQLEADRATLQSEQAVLKADQVLLAEDQRAWQAKLEQFSAAMR